MRLPDQILCLTAAWGIASQLESELLSLMKNCPDVSVQVDRAFDANAKTLASLETALEDLRD